MITYSTVHPTDYCPLGWSKNIYSGSCVASFHRHKFWWTEAKVFCKRLGADLLEILGSEENNYIFGEKVIFAVIFFTVHCVLEKSWQVSTGIETKSWHCL